MTCCFFGHSICPFDIRPKIKVQIEKMLTESEKVTFYVGNHGQFDSIPLVTALRIYASHTTSARKEVDFTSQKGYNSSCMYTSRRRNNHTERGTSWTISSSADATTR